MNNHGEMTYEDAVAYLSRPLTQREKESHTAIRARRIVAEAAKKRPSHHKKPATEVSAEAEALAKEEAAEAKVAADAARWTKEKLRQRQRRNEAEARGARRAKERAEKEIWRAPLFAELRAAGFRFELLTAPNSIKRSTVELCLALIKLPKEQLNAPLDKLRPMFPREQGIVLKGVIQRYGAALGRVPQGHPKSKHLKKNRP